LREANLVGVESIDALLARLESHPYEGQWLLGRGFDQDILAEGRFPTRADLDKISMTRPIRITRICGHAIVVNSAALGLVSPESRALGDEGNGLYTETAMMPFLNIIPPLTESEGEEAVLKASQIALKTGITRVGTLLDTADQMGAYTRLQRRGKLPLRVTGMPPYASIAALHSGGIGTTFGNDALRFGGAKFFSDGSLGARTALLAEPYTDMPDAGLGIRIYDPEDLKQKCADAQTKGFQIVIHAIGDQAVRESLEAIEFALEASSHDNTYHRHRIEHASILPPDLLARMAERQILAVVQPQFVTSDTWSGERVGALRKPWVYPFQTMRQAGISLALSSDCPVEKLDAFACLSAAVNRHPWSPNECLSISEALHAYCLGGAYSLFQEHTEGSLEVGKYADCIVLSEEPTAANLNNLSVERVFIAGNEVAL
jgi:predicted amidohydrolase YtcJ